VFELPRRYAEEIIAHAREEAPNECCGILAGEGGRVLRMYRAVNAEHSPYRFDIDSRDLYRIHAEVEALGWEFVAIYHSHPQSEAYPSSTDVAMARLPGSGETVELWPGTVYLIVSLADPASPQIRAFRFEKGAVVEEALELTG
jgi:proteasome lid subunit RPN8/RPN11